EGVEFEVLDTQKDGALVIHIGHVRQGVLREGAKVRAVIDAQRRDGIRRAHSATHILHHALRKHLGQHAQQQGSKVDADWLRFDFSNLSPVDGPQLATIAAEVAAHIDAGEPVRWDVLPLAEARQQGAMMLFGEKYPDPVRMVSMGQFSKELCGGTHLDNTRDVGGFEILSEEGVAAGTRRIVALTGARAAEHRQLIEAQAVAVGKLLGVAPLAAPLAVHALVEERRELKRALDTGVKPKEPAPRPSSGETAPETLKAALSSIARALSVAPLGVVERVEALRAEITTLKARLAEREAAGPLDADALLDKATDHGGVKMVLAELPGVEPGLMRQLIDQIRRKAPLSAIMFATREGDDKVTLVAGVSKQLQERGVSAGKWIGPVAKAVGGG
ncbi:MAG TPA: DHHA1 domain-containing protein, partial [Lacipirellulaceae bacterium]|nr:DHHA1 domain-containing protein [Lacipirellulaceae bacterium]